MANTGFKQASYDIYVAEKKATDVLKTAAADTNFVKFTGKNLVCGNLYRFSVVFDTDHDSIYNHPIRSLDYTGLKTSLGIVDSFDIPHPVNPNNIEDTSKEVDVKYTTFHATVTGRGWKVSDLDAPTASGSVLSNIKAEYTYSLKVESRDGLSQNTFKLNFAHDKLYNYKNIVVSTETVVDRAARVLNLSIQRGPAFPGKNREDLNYYLVWHKGGELPQRGYVKSAKCQAKVTFDLFLQKDLGENSLTVEIYRGTKEPFTVDLPNTVTHTIGGVEYSTDNCQAWYQVLSTRSLGVAGRDIFDIYDVAFLCETGLPRTSFYVGETASIKVLAIQDDGKLLDKTTAAVVSVERDETVPGVVYTGGKLFFSHEGSAVVNVALNAKTSEGAVYTLERKVSVNVYTSQNSKEVRIANYRGAGIPATDRFIVAKDSADPVVLNIRFGGIGESNSYYDDGKSISKGTCESIELVPAEDEDREYDILCSGKYVVGSPVDYRLKQLGFAPVTFKELREWVNVFTYTVCKVFGNVSLYNASVEVDVSSIISEDGVLDCTTDFKGLDQNAYALDVVCDRTEGVKVVGAYLNGGSLPDSVEKIDGDTCGVRISDCDIVSGTHTSCVFNSCRFSEGVAVESSEVNGCRYEQTTKNACSKSVFKGCVIGGSEFKGILCDDPCFFSSCRVNQCYIHDGRVAKLDVASTFVACVFERIYGNNVYIDYQTRIRDGSGYREYYTKYVLAGIDKPFESADNCSECTFVACDVSDFIATDLPTEEDLALGKARIVRQVTNRRENEEFMLVYALQNEEYESYKRHVETVNECMYYLKLLSGGRVNENTPVTTAFAMIQSYYYEANQEWQAAMNGTYKKYSSTTLGSNYTYAKAYYLSTYTQEARVYAEARNWWSARLSAARSKTDYYVWLHALYDWKNQHGGASVSTLAQQALVAEQKYWEEKKAEDEKRLKEWEEARKKEQEELRKQRLEDPYYQWLKSDEGRAVVAAYGPEVANAAYHNPEMYEVSYSQYDVGIDGPPSYWGTHEHVYVRKKKVRYCVECTCIMEYGATAIVKGVCTTGEKWNVPRDIEWWCPKVNNWYAIPGYDERKQRIGHNCYWDNGTIVDW